VVVEPQWFVELEQLEGLLPRAKAPGRGHERESEEIHPPLRLVPTARDLGVDRP